MKKIFSLCMCLFFVLIWGVMMRAQVYKPTDTFTDATPLILFDFDKKGNFNDLSGAWGNFDANPIIKHIAEPDSPKIRIYIKLVII